MQKISLTHRAFATFEIRHALLFEQITASVQQRFGDFSPKQLGVLAWSLGKLEFPALPLLVRMCGTVAADMALFKSQEIATVIWAVAKLHQHHQGKGTQQDKGEPAGTDPADTVTTKTAEASAASEAAAAVRAVENIATNIDDRIFQFSLHDTARTSWALAKMEVNQAPVASLFKRIERAALERVKSKKEHASMKMLGTLDILGAYAKLGFRADALASFFCSQVDCKEKLGIFPDLSRVAWIMASLQPITQPSKPFDSQYNTLFEAIAKAATDRFDTLTPTQVVNLAWSLGRVKVNNHIFLKQVREFSENNLHNFTATELVQLTWAFARLNICRLSLFNRVEHVLLTTKQLTNQDLRFKEKTSLLQELPITHLVQLVWSYAQLRISARGLFLEVSLLMKEKGPFFKNYFIVIIRIIVVISYFSS